MYDQVPLIPKPSKFNTVNWFIAIISFLLLIALGSGVIIYFTNTTTPQKPLETLSLQDLVQKWDKSQIWNLIEYYYGRENILLTDPNIIQVTYPAGSYQNTGGFKFYSQPSGFPTNKACLTYSVLFPINFQWMKGGKLPGMWIGDIGANGGNHIENGFSARFMWRSGGNAEVYLYVPSNQTSEYNDQIISNNDYGDSLWRGMLKLKNDWNYMRLCITLDGVLEAQVNNVTMRYDKLLWPHDLKINGIMMNSFFGGNDPSWAPNNTMYTYFKDFSVIS